VRGADERTIDDMRHFPLTTRGGARIPLSEVASVTTGSEPPVARRWQRERTVTITYGFSKLASASADTVNAARASVDRAIADLELPEGHYVDVEHADEGISSTRTMIYLGLALVFAVLAVTFESITLPFLVMLSVPLAAVGVIAALMLTGTGANQFVMLALVVLLGIVVNQGILFVDRSEELRASGSSRAAATLRAAHDRLRPILMTTASTTVGMIPLAVSTGGEQEIWPPFARALLGGLISATLISLVFIPCGALALGWLRDLLARLTPPLVAATTAAWGLILWWAFFLAEIVVSEPLRWLLAIPAWLLALATARAGQHLWRGERPPDLVGAAEVDLRVRNARKIYGGPPRFVRELRRVDRWKMIAERAGLSASDIRSPRQAKLALTWQVGALGLLGYVHALAESSWGLFLLTIPTLAILSGLAASLAVLARVPGAWPLRSWPARILPLAAATGAWMYLLLRRREDSEADIATLVVAGGCYGAWALLHLAREGGAIGMMRRRVSPQPVVALDGVNMSFENGLYGLLGPNGAGKSTLMRLVVNLYRPTRGTVTVNGHEVHANAASIQPRIGYLPQFFGVPPRLSAREYLHHQALLAGQVDPAKRTELVEAVLAEVGLTDRAGEKLGGYSGGMRQRVGIARTLLNVPRIVVVDEPTVGLDPRERIRFRNLLAELAKTRIVLLSTHVVEDIGSSCREVIVLDRGLILFRGAPVELVSRAQGHAWTCEVEESDLRSLSRAHRVVTTTRLPGGTVRVRGVGTRPAGATDVDATLEDAYLLLLGRSSRELPDAA
jgi:ABC-type multidrug transport system ATPase subunit/preprotein translocase subunit SecF